MQKRYAPLRAGLRQRGRNFFFAYLPGTYASSRLAGTRQRDRAIFSRPAQAGLTTSRVFLCSAKSYAASAQTPCQHD